MARLNVNGAVREFEAEGDTPLLWVLREQLGLTGTKYGCGIAACGACTVHIDGVPTRTCVRPMSTVEPTAKIVTIEGLSPDGSHPVQRPQQRGITLRVHLVHHAVDVQSRHAALLVIARAS